MSNFKAFQCPACRARQDLQDNCRRCGADLTLLVKLRRRIDWLVDQRERLSSLEESVAADRIGQELAELTEPRAERLHIVFDPRQE